MKKQLPGRFAKKRIFRDGQKRKILRWAKDPKSEGLGVFGEV